MNLSGKKILITGGSTGIGKASAIFCAQKGATVAIIDKNISDGDITVKTINDQGGKSKFFSTDVSVESSVERSVKESTDFLGGIDGLICSAGILFGGLIPVDSFDSETWERVIDVNLKGSFYTCKYVVKEMKKNKKGVILLISSKGGITHGSSSVAYGSSKGGIGGLGLTLARELNPFGIRVNVVCPGSLKTPLKIGAIKQQEKWIGKEAKVEDQISGLANPEGVGKVLSLLISDEADYVEGFIFTK